MLARRARRAASSSTSSATSGSHGPDRLLARLAHDRGPALPALRDLGALPARDRALGRPRDDAGDAELGRRLDRELVAVALGERLHEPRAPVAAAPRRRRSSTSIVELRGSASTTAPRTTRPRAVADRDPLADAHPRDRDGVPRLVARDASRRAPAAASVARGRAASRYEVSSSRRRDQTPRKRSRSFANRPCWKWRTRAPPAGASTANCWMSSRLLAVEPRRRDDLDADLEVAATAAAQAGDAAILDRDDLGALRARLDLDRRRSPSSPVSFVVVPRIASVICTSRVASRSSPLRLKMSWCLTLISR